MQRLARPGGSGYSALHEARRIEGGDKNQDEREAQARAGPAQDTEKGCAPDARRAAGGMRARELPPDAAEVAARVEREGGLVIGSYCEPLGRNPLLLAALPIDRVEPTPFQRDLSDAHHKKLSGVIDKTGLFLDPVIAITAPKEGFWTPNGRHRLEAMRRLGAKSIIALVVPKREIAWQILALNTEKAHNLRERVARGDSHLQGPDRGGREAAGKRFRVLSRGGGARDARAVLRAQGQFRGRRVSPDPAASRRVLLRLDAASRSPCTSDTPSRCSSSTSGSPKSSTTEGAWTRSARTCAPSSSRASIRCAGSRTSRRHSMRF